MAPLLHHRYKFLRMFAVEEIKVTEEVVLHSIVSKFSQIWIISSLDILSWLHEDV